MYKTSLNVRVSWFRHRVFVWILLAILAWYLVPGGSLAQQPTATIKTLSGNVLVSGQAANVGTILNAGDTIQTQAGAQAVLLLSEGSELRLGQNTKIDITTLTQKTRARTSRIKLLYGKIRAILSPGHQKEGSSFDIETPNAIAGVKFSQPDVEVSYDPAKQETVALALTVALAVKNLLTDEEKIIPVGSVAIIIGLEIKVLTGAAAAEIISSSEAEITEAEPAEAATAETGKTGTAAAGTAATATGIGTGTIVAISAGALAAAGGVAAVVASSGDGDSSPSSGDGNGDSSQPALGPWAGQDISFTVSEGSIIVNNLLITYRQQARWGSVPTRTGDLNCNYLAFEDTASFNSIPVTDNSFNVDTGWPSDPYYEVNGTFTSPSSVTIEFLWGRTDVGGCAGTPVLSEDTQTYTASPQ